MSYKPSSELSLRLHCEGSFKIFIKPSSPECGRRNSAPLPTTLRARDFSFRRLKCPAVFLTTTHINNTSLRNSQRVLGLIYMGGHTTLSTLLFPHAQPSDLRLSHSISFITILHIWLGFGSIIMNNFSGARDMICILIHWHYATARQCWYNNYIAKL